MVVIRYVEKFGLDDVWDFVLLIMVICFCIDCSCVIFWCLLLGGSMCDYLGFRLCEWVIVYFVFCDWLGLI